MAEITILIDDSAERKRRKRQRWIEIAIVLVVVSILPVLGSRSPGAGVGVGRTDATTTTDRTDTTGTTGTTGTTDTTATTQGPDTPVVPPPDREPPQQPQPFTVTPAAINFNARNVPAQLVTIKNAEHVVLLKANAKDFLITDNCGAGAPCVAAIVFAPTTEGHRNGKLTVIGNGRTKTVSLSGYTPIPPPPPPLCTSNQPAIDPPGVHFIGTGRRTITLSNPHPCALRVEAINLMNADRPGRKASGYKLIGDASCKRVLQPGERCSFDVATSPWHFTPRATIAVQSSAVTP